MLLETIIRFDKTVIDSKWVALNIITMPFFCNILVYVHQEGDQKHEGLDSQKMETYIHETIYKTKRAGALHCKYIANYVFGILREWQR